MLALWQKRWLRWRRRFSRAEWAARHLGFKLSAEEGDAPGLLLIQIDGLARRQLERALRNGRMPFLRRLLQRHGHGLHTFYSGQPASTPAVQGEIHYGVRTAVPAFSFLDRQAGGIGMMMHPGWARRVEERLTREGGGGLLRGGSSWSNIYTGGAAPDESHFCAASIGWGKAWRSMSLPLVFTALLLHLDIIVRVLGLLVLELAVGVRDLLEGVFLQGRHPGKELLFLFARVAVVVGLREIVTAGAAIDLARGLPVVHVNFLGYDEQSHRRGPDSAFAHWTLLGIDRCVRRLHRAARRSGRRDYEVWVFSDHGQTACRQAGQVVSGGLEELVARHWPALAGAGDETPRRRVSRPQLRPSPGHWLGGPRASRRESGHEAETRLSVFEENEFAVAALGPVGHVYYGHDIGAAASRLLAAALVREGVPGVLWCEGDKVAWLEPGGEHRLPDDAALLGVEAELQAELAADLVALCRHPQAGNLVAIGWAPGRECWTFASENGAHAGPSPDEVTGFVVLPPATWLPAGTEHHLRPATLRRAVLRRLDRDRRSDSGLSGPEEGERERGRSPVRTSPLRVVTYNVHGCLGTDGRLAPRRVARVLAQFDADIVALQEVDRGRTRSRGEDQVALIAQQLGLHHCFCPTVERGQEHYGHGLLARAPIKVVKSGLLNGRPGRLSEPRAALWAEITCQGRRLQVISTHLGLRSEDRWRQISDLLAEGWIGGLNGDDPVILCGDLNLHPGSRGYRRLAGRLRDAQAHAPGHVAQRTFPSVFPVRCLDYVFVSEHLGVEAVQVPRDSLTVATSDHLPLVCDLHLR